MKRLTNAGRLALTLWVLTVAILLPSGVWAAGEGPTAGDDAAVALEGAVDSAQVEVDGMPLFRVRGIVAYPAQKRAEAIADRIVALASDRAFEPQDVVIVESEGALAVMGGELRVMMLVDADAALEGVSKSELALVVQGRIREAIVRYRSNRTRDAVLSSTWKALAATGVVALALVLLFTLWRRLDARVTERVHRRMQELKVESLKLVRLEDVGQVVRAILRTLRTLLAAVFVFLYLQLVLGLFPWTRWMHQRLADWLVGPLETMGAAVLSAIPNLIFLVILILVMRWVVKLVRLFFEAIERGTLTLADFDPDWAQPTYKIVRLALIGFGLVVAYPYIPGSSSAAFKGVSLFAGLVFSLGSSSIVSNIIAGYTMTYRRAYRVGDRVRIGDITGEVTAIRLQVTSIRTPKNEEVIIPNSLVTGSEVTNFSVYARTQGLILHTTVGIGYETPWRQVEAMLLMAAERTEGLRRDPPPFVLQRQLGDFCVTYEINAYTDQAHNILGQYTALHRHILDVFNEYNVQIMTPAYEGDPDQAKVVPREQWYSAPAAVPRDDKKAT